MGGGHEREGGEREHGRVGESAYPRVGSGATAGPAACASPARLLPALAPARESSLRRLHLLSALRAARPPRRAALDGVEGGHGAYVSHSVSSAPWVVWQQLCGVQPCVLSTPTLGRGYGIVQCLQSTA